jgi:hypothetical protein
LRRYQGPVRKDGPKVELEVYASLTTTPYELVACVIWTKPAATINHERMPVLLTREEELETVRTSPPKSLQPSGVLIT